MTVSIYISKKNNIESLSECGKRLLIVALQTEYNISKPKIVCNEYGKPLLKNSDVFFNISHSGNYAMCGVAKSPIGVDLQQERIVTPKLYRKFSESEQQLIRSNPNNFYDLWCLKEAYGKCIGKGLLIPLDATSFTLKPLSLADNTEVQIKTFDFLPNYHTAICVQTLECLNVKVNLL